MATAVPRALLRGAPEEAAAAIVAAISAGESTCVFHALGRPEGFALRLPDAAPAASDPTGPVPAKATSGSPALEGTAPADAGPAAARPARQLKVGERLEVLVPPGAREHARLRVWGPGRLESDGRHVVADGEGLLQVEVWLEAPGRLYGSEPKPWLVPSPIRIVR